MFDLTPFDRYNSQIARSGDYFNHLLNHFFDDDLIAPTHFYNATGFKVDLMETDEKYTVIADMPGVKRDSIDIGYQNDYLTLSAKTENNVEDKTENYIRRERHMGEMKRYFYISNVDEDKIDASFENGILTINLPKLEKGNTNKKKIEIH